MSRERLFEASTILMESLWYFAFASAFVAWFGDGDGPPFWPVLLAAAGGFYLLRLLGHLGMPLDFMRLLALAISSLCLYAILRLVYIDDLYLWDLSWLKAFVEHPGQTKEEVAQGSFLICALWLRWAIQSQSTISLNTVIGSFSIGFVAVVFGALIDIPDSISTASDEVMVPFFAVGLITMAFFRIGGASSDATRMPMDRTWVIASLGVVALLVLLAAPAWLVGGVNADPVFEPIGHAVGWVVDGIINVLAVPVGAFFRLMGWLVRTLIGDALPEQQQQQNENTEPPEPEEGNNRFRIPLLFIGRTIVGLLLVALLALIVWFVISRLGRGNRDRSEVRESVWHEGSLFEDMGDLLGQLFGRRRRRAVQPPELAADLLAVRRLYLDVLESAEDRGLERPQAKTPLEFAPPLAEHFHSGTPREVTRAFTRARYGLKGLPPEELERLRKAWRETSH